MKTTEQKRIFDRELILSIANYLIVCTLLAVINYVTSSYPWVLWVAGGWGFALILKIAKNLCSKIGVITVFITLLSTINGTAQQIDSKILQKSVKYSVSLPTDYESGKSYPVLYLLHGYGRCTNPTRIPCQRRRSHDELLEAAHSRNANIHRQMFH